MKHRPRAANFSPHPEDESNREPNPKQVNIRNQKKGQRGFSLIEMLLVIAITSLIAGGLATTILQVMTMTHRTSNRMTAVRQVQQAGFWVSPDVMMAQNVSPSGTSGSGFPLTLNWTDPGTNSHHRVIYSLEGSGDLRILQRKHYIDSELDSTIIVAEYIDPNYTNIDPKDPCSYPNCAAYIFTVTATLGGQSETRTYEVKPRPGS